MTKHRAKQDVKPSANTGQTRPQEEALSAAEILSMGEQAANLLDDPIYNLAHRSVVRNLQDEWMSTSPHESQKREGLYQQIRGLSAVAGEMAAMISQAQQVSDDELTRERKLQLAYSENSGF